MVNETGSEQLRTGLVTDAIRYHVRLVIVCVLVGLGLAYAFTYATATSYTSTASVLINPLLGNPYSPDGSGDDLTNLETEAQLVRSDVLATEVNDKTGVAVDELKSHLLVTVPVNTQILDIAYTAPHADEAAQVANAYAYAYLAVREQNRNRVVQGQILGLEQQITNAQKALQRASTRAENGDAYAGRLAQTLTGQLASLRIQAAQISTSGRRAGGVLTPGTPPSSPDGLPLAVVLAAGLLLGLAVSGLLAISHERSAHLVRHVRHVEAAGVRVLGVLSGKKGEDRPAVYRRLRASLMGAPVMLNVAACTKDSGSSVIAGELALSMMRGGRRVLLVDVVGSVSRLMLPSSGSHYGLSDALTGQVQVSRAVIPLSYGPHPELLLMTPGRDPVAGAEMYGTDAMLSIFDELEERCDNVVVASAGIAEADGPALTAQADSVVLVVTLNVTSTVDIAAAADWLRRSNTVLVGAIVVATSKLSPSKTLGGPTVTTTSVRDGGLSASQPARANDNRVSAPRGQGATVARNA